jgi:hypothetical protein
MRKFSQAWRWSTSAMAAGRATKLAPMMSTMPSQKVTLATTVRLATLAAESPAWE